MTIIYLGLLSILFSLFISLIFSNPGTVPKNSTTFLQLIENKAKINNYCPYCVNPKPENTKHCSYCERCVKNFDHHCYWIGNCIGEGNLIRFSWFVFVVLLNLIIHIYIASYCIATNGKIMESTGIGSNEKYFSFPPLFKFLSPFYTNNIKMMFSISLLFICICFLIPVTILFVFNMKNNFCKFKRKRREAVKMEEETILIKNENDNNKGV